MSPAEGDHRDARDSPRSCDAFADAAEGVPALDLHVFHGGHLGLVAEAAEVAPVISRFLSAGAGSGRAG